LARTGAHGRDCRGEKRAGGKGNFGPLGIGASSIPGAAGKREFKLNGLKKHTRKAEYFQECLRGKGIMLPAAEIATVAKMMREEILRQYVTARGRIHRLQRINGIKERIVDQIFLKLGRRQGVKMKEVFDLVIPEVVDIIKIQRCALFSVTEDRECAVLESGYPEAEHGIGKSFSVKEEPYINAVVNLNVPLGEFENETVRYKYIFVRYPQKSDLIPLPLKGFLETRAIHAVLYVPLRVSGAVKYFLTFDSQDQHERFSEGEIEILTFLGKELLKGLRLEKMNDLLHDFRNPAIAAAGFSRRVKRILQQGLFPQQAGKVYHWLDIINEETCRIQDLALILYGEGRDDVIDLTARLERRFVVNTEALREMKREGIRLVPQDSGPALPVRCFPLHLDRVLDNLLGNAGEAVPEEGGELSIRSYPQDSWGVAEIVNTGRISEEDRDRLLLGESTGRGLDITVRLIKHMGGKLDLELRGDRTIFRVSLPLVDETNEASGAGVPPPCGEEAP
jgi:signal transduction histidine kinase